MQARWHSSRDDRLSMRWPRCLYGGDLRGDRADRARDVPRGCRSFIESLTCSVSCSFRACLKMVDTSDANLVGKLFFNVVQTKCFVIKPKKVCVRSSWWGQCQKYKHVKQAILRDNLPY
ncbi:hypothetical protein MTP99_018278 [Tenebrio molitor]|nr:hypothetical protein MTP99_018278 [Tenebrio molitor]